MGSQKINKILRDRKAQRKKLGKYRRGRIWKKYNQNKQHYQQQFDQKLSMNPMDQKRKQYYEQIFSKDPSTNTNHKGKINHKLQTINHQERQNKDQYDNQLSKIKDKKKKYIKKIQKEKTSRGQPIMKNYIKYALSKIQETILKEKKQKK